MSVYSHILSSYSRTKNNNKKYKNEPKVKNAWKKKNTIKTTEQRELCFSHSKFSISNNRYDTEDSIGRINICPFYCCESNSLFRIIHLEWCNVVGLHAFRVASVSGGRCCSPCGSRSFCTAVCHETRDDCRHTVHLNTDETGRGKRKDKCTRLKKKKKLKTICKTSEYWHAIECALCTLILWLVTIV